MSRNERSKERDKKMRLEFTKDLERLKGLLPSMENEEQKVSRLAIVKAAVEDVANIRTLLHKYEAKYGPYSSPAPSPVASTPRSYEGLGIQFSPQMYTIPPKKQYVPKIHTSTPIPSRSSWSSAALASHSYLRDMRGDDEEGLPESPIPSSTVKALAARGLVPGQNLIMFERGEEQRRHQRRLPKTYCPTPSPEIMRTPLPNRENMYPPPPSPLYYGGNPPSPFLKSFNYTPESE